MDLPRNRQQPGAVVAVVRQAGVDVETQADGLLGSVLEGQAGQAALFNANYLESRYGAALAAQVEAKHDQAGRIEDKLEKLIEAQASDLQQTQIRQPGMFALPGARVKWQRQVTQQQNAIQRLHGRLETVREIKEGMGIHGPRIEELASRKLRAQEPGLASEWDELWEARRRHQALQRKQEQDEKQALERGQRAQSGRGMHLGLSPDR